MDPNPRPVPVQTPPRKRHGCFFYGIIISLLFVLFAGIVVVLVSVHLVKLANETIAEYTDTKPVTLPRSDMSPAETKALKDRLTAFGQALGAGSNAPPLVLTGRDLNALLNDALTTGTPPMQALTNSMHVDVAGDRIEGQVSLPADRMLHVPFIHTEGRYLNGAVAFKVVLTNDHLSVFMDTLTVKGKPLPEPYQSQLRQIDFAADAQNNASNAAAISRFESIEIHDGKLVITPKKPEASK